MWADRKRRSFTLIETSMVTALIAIISLAVYASFSAGVRVWQKANRESARVQVNIFFDKVSNDLRNWLAFSAIEPKGDQESVAFAVAQEKTLAPGADSAFGRVRYYFDGARSRVYRSYQDYAELARGTPEPAGQPILEEIRAFALSYYYFDPVTKKGSWGEAIDTQVPSAVKIDVEFMDNQRLRRLSKIVAIYVSG